MIQCHLLMYVLSTCTISSVYTIQMAPLYLTEEPILDRYIVVLKNEYHVDDFVEAFSYTTRLQTNPPVGSFEIGFEYRHALRGIAVSVTKTELNKIRKSELVKYVQEDGFTHLQASYANSTVKSWGLARISQRNLPLEDKFNPLAHATGVHVYIIDTGVRLTHEEFRGRLGNGVDIFDGDEEPDDCQGHGSHVAGTAVGAIHGVATNATLHAVKVFGCESQTPTSVVIRGIDWVVENHIVPSVASISLSGFYSQAENDAVDGLVAAGITTVLSAGNGDDDACNFSPGSTPNGITVGATDINDQKAGYSNVGQCVDIFAPGTDIPSVWFRSNDDMAVLSGTSMAAPHVSGAAAVLLGLNYALTPEDIKQTLIVKATENKITNLDNDSPNRLLFIGVIE